MNVFENFFQVNSVIHGLYLSSKEIMVNKNSKCFRRFRGKVYEKEIDNISKKK